MQETVFSVPSKGGNSVSISILESIEKAEVQAENIRTQATREAREIIKSVEEATANNLRHAQRANTEETQRRMDAARILIGDEIRELEKLRAQEREKMKKQAGLHVEQAGELIFERVVSDGHC